MAQITEKQKKELLKALSKVNDKDMEKMKALTKYKKTKENIPEGTIGKTRAEEINERKQQENFKKLTKEQFESANLQPRREYNPSNPFGKTRFQRMKELVPSPTGGGSILDAFKKFKDNPFKRRDAITQPGKPQKGIPKPGQAHTAVQSRAPTRKKGR